MSKIYIYALIDPRNNKIRYIGKTNNLNKRLNEHILGKRNNHKYNWIRALEKENLKPLIQVIDTANDLNWKTKENYWISMFPNLINMCSGGNAVDDKFKVRGEKHHKSKLTELQVLKIMELYKYTNLSIIDLGKLFNINYNSINEILIGETWKTVNHGKKTISLFNKKKYNNNTKGEKHGKTSLKEIDVIEIKKELLNSRIFEIANKYGVSWDTIYKIKNGKTWRHTIV